MQYPKVNHDHDIPIGTSLELPRYRLPSSVAVVILNWNGFRDTLVCLDSLERSLTHLHVILVDNGSTDASVKTLKQWLDQARIHEYQLIESGSNLGFCGGNNCGIKAALDAGAEYVLLLNNDTRVPAQTIRRLIEELSTYSQAGAIAPRFVDFAGRPNYTGESLSYWRGLGLTANQTTETNFLPGAGMLIRCNVLQQVGLFPEEFFAYAEDTDLCWRIREAGWKLLYLDSAVIEHRGSGSSGGRWSPTYFYYASRNGLYFATTRLTGLERISCLAFFIGKKLLQMLYCAATGRGKVASAVLVGLWDFVRRRKGQWRAKLSSVQTGQGHLTFEPRSSNRV